MNLSSSAKRIARTTLALLAGIGPLTAQEPPPKKPNIIYILADDLGYGELGCYGQTKIKTPHLDQMAAEGMRFTQHYSGAAICAPSRFTLLTGQHIGRSHTYGQGQRLKDADLTLHKLAKRAGYATGAIGKWDLGKDPNQQGVDSWYGFISQGYAHFFYPEKIWKNEHRIEIPENHRELGLRAKGKYTDKIKDGGYIHDEFTKEALSFIDDNHNKPFFLYLPYTIPHLELVVPEDSIDQYRGQFPETPYDTETYRWNGKKIAAGGAKFYDGKGYCSSDNPRTTYAAMITRMDRDIGRIFARLKKLGIDENTLVIFSSDNGPAWWEAGGCDREFFQSAGHLRDGKNSYYEGGLRVPMIARWPGKIRPNSVSDHVSYFPDILPTFAELLRSPVNRKIDGISLVPTLLERDGQIQHPYLFWQYALRKGRWKLVTGGRNFDGTKNQAQLFDLSRDPGETIDLSAKHPDVLENLLKLHRENQIPRN